MPSHYLNQCWDIVNWIFRNKLQWNINRNQYIFIQENASENVVYSMVSISSRPQWVNQTLYKCGQHFTGTSCGKNFHFESTHSIDWVPRWRKRLCPCSNISHELGNALEINIIPWMIAEISILLHGNLLKAAILTVLVAMMVMNSESPKSNKTSRRKRRHLKSPRR